MQLVVETFRNLGEPSSRPIRVRPVAGQLPGDFRVWCSVSQREAKPVGALFRVSASWVLPKGREPYLRISPGEPWIPVSPADALALGKGGRLAPPPRSP
jgi:hypothetical protein